MNTEKSRDEKFLERAIELSKKGMEGGKGGPFGCIVVKGNEIIGEGSNEVTSSNNYAYVADNDYSENTYTKNVFIYNKTKVTPYLSIKLFGSGGYRLRQVAQAFDLKSNGERLIIAVNHLKAKAELPRIFLNGGKRGYLIGVDPAEVVRVLQPTLVNVAVVG